MIIVLKVVNMNFSGQEINMKLKRFIFSTAIRAGKTKRAIIKILNVVGVGKKFNFLSL